jgi:hypothetical protein
VNLVPSERSSDVKFEIGNVLFVPSLAAKE